MATDQSKTMSVRFGSDLVLAIRAHIDDMREVQPGVQFNFTDSLNHLLALGIERVAELRAERAPKKKR